MDSDSMTTPTQSSWYTGISAKIKGQENGLDERWSRRYKIYMLSRLAGRVDQFSPICYECQSFQSDISRIADELGNVIETSDRVRFKETKETINKITKHLQRRHRFITPGQYTATWAIIGVVLGALLGARMGNYAAGMLIGILLGIIIGALQEKRAKVHDRVI